MRYSKEHKFQTHARIVKKASVKLREKGAHGIGVADLMKDAGLTHGGFYAHFDSRDALVIEAFTHAMDRSIARWRKLAEETPVEKRLSKIVNHYLAPVHRDDPGQGCAVPALATMMGSLVMARVAGNSELSDEILKSGRDAVLGRTSPVTKKPAKRATA